MVSRLLEHKLTLSNTKSKILINKSLSKCHNRNSNIILSSNKLEVVNNFKYLGLYIDNNLRFTQHINKIFEKTKKINFGLRRKFYLSYNLPLAKSFHTI